MPNVYQRRLVAPRVAYFSMEIGLESEIPTYSGGLGVLAGDSLRAAADLRLPVVGLTLVHREGYFRQELDHAGRQSEIPHPWDPAARLQELEPWVSVELEGRTVHLRAWRYRIQGSTGGEVPVFLLDADLPENTDDDRTLTDHLYGGNRRYRLKQEALLGIGGVRLLRALGYRKIHTYHMNEGHSALLALELLAERAGPRGVAHANHRHDRAVRERCVFTTHTPVPAGHDRFEMRLVREVLGEENAQALDGRGTEGGDFLNMSELALHFSRWSNGVALRHGQVSRAMFPTRSIGAITNGVHVVTWASPWMQDLFDRHVPGWRQDPMQLRHAVALPLDELRTAHTAAKARMIDAVGRRTGVWLDPDTFTLGFARRATSYKRADLLLSDTRHLRKIARKGGGLQVVYAGKAHPRDAAGKALIRRIHQIARRLANDVTVVYVPGYDMELGAILTAGVDVWLNTPEKPKEASGTSGMKAALNGVPQLSVLDGWWVEGHLEGVTGWSLDEHWEHPSDQEAETQTLYRKLEETVLPLYYGDPLGFDRVRRYAIALNGGHFSTRRMMLQYVTDAYRLDTILSDPAPRPARRRARRS